MTDNPEPQADEAALDSTPSEERTAGVRSEGGAAGNSPPAAAPDPPTAPEAPAPSYRVRAGIATRRQPDPACEDWLSFRVGRKYAAGDFPPHVDLAALLASGHLEEVR